MANLTPTEVDAIVSCRPEYKVSATDFARDVAAILADYSDDRAMQMLHLIRYRYYLEDHFHLRQQSA